MKKLYLLIPVVCILSFLPGKAQIGKGRILTGVTSTIGIGDFGSDLMNAGLTTQKYKSGSGSESEGDKSFGINLAPRIGYFLVNNVAVGIDILGKLYSVKSEDGESKDTEYTVAAGPFARVYLPLEKFYPFVEGNVGYGFWKEKYSGTSEWEEKEALLIYGFGVGVARPIGENAMIDAMVGYSNQTWKDEDDDKYIYGTIGLRVGITILCGQKK